MKTIVLDYAKAERLAAEGKTLKDAAPFLRIPYATLCLKKKTDQKFSQVWNAGREQFKKAHVLSEQSGEKIEGFGAVALSAARARKPDKIPSKKFGDPELEEMRRAKYIKTLKHRVESVVAAGEILFHRIAAKTQLSPDDLADALSELKLDRKITEVQKGSFTAYFLIGSEPQGEWSILDGKVLVQGDKTCQK